MNSTQKWLSNKYLIYRMLTNAWFVGAVWLYFYRIFITDQQVGILDGMAFAIGVIAEVPSGALADKFGRDRLVRIGQVMAGSGLIIQALGSSFAPFFIGQAILMIGVSFVSGADEALFFSKLNFDRKSTSWRKLVTRGGQAALIGSVVATVAGGLLHSANPRLPWIFNGVAFILAVIIIWPIRDDRPQNKFKDVSQELKDYLLDIKTGFGQFRLPKLWIYVPIIITVQGLFYTAGWGMLRVVLLSRFHFNPFWGSIVIAMSSLTTVLILSLMHKYADDLSEKRVLTLISLSAVAGLLLSISNIGTLGALVILAFYAGEHALHPFMSEILNNHAPDDTRATVLSVANFLRTVPYVALAPIIGYLNTNGNLVYFLIFWSVLIVLAVLLYISNLKRDAKISLAADEVI